MKKTSQLFGGFADNYLEGANLIDEEKLMGASDLLCLVSPFGCMASKNRETEVEKMVKAFAVGAGGIARSAAFLGSKYRNGDTYIEPRLTIDPIRGLVDVIFPLSSTFWSITARYQ